MKKICKIICLNVLILLCLGCVSCKKNKPVETTFPEIVNGLTSYKLVGRLESNFPSGTKECEITTYYKSPNNYRVEIQNPNNNETQIMVKNSSGVYVLIPSINKTFKVNSNWPGNTSYPYLLQSLRNDIVSDENLRTTTEGKDTIIELKAKLFNQDEQTTQKIIFGENKLPKEVLFYDSNQNLLTRFVVKSLEQNITIDDDQFNATESLETLASYFDKNPIEFERLVSYPTYYPEGTSLKEETVTGTKDNKLAIMKFTGTSNFTIVEQFVNKATVATTEHINGDLYIMGGVFTFVGDNHIEFYENGVQYTIASNQVTQLEMIKMADSLRSGDNK